MKILSLIIIVLFMSTFVLLFPSCSDDDRVIDVTDDFAFIDTSILISDPAKDPLILGKNEYHINTIRLYAFDGDRLDNMVFNDNVTPDAQGRIISRIKVKQSASKTIYAIINEPSGLSGTLALINHPDAFNHIEYTLADYFNVDAMHWNHNFDTTTNGLPLFGKNENVNSIPTNGSTTITVPLSVIRSLARVDIMLQKKEELNSTDIQLDNQSTLSIFKVREKGWLASGTPITVGQLTDKAAIPGDATAHVVATANATDNTNARRIFSFYTPERDCSADASKLSFKLSNIKWGTERKDFDVVTIGSIGDNPLNTIERNKVYRVFCTFVSKGIDMNINVQEWSTVNIDSDTQADMELSFSRSKIAMDYAAQENSFTTNLHIYANFVNEPPYQVNVDENIYFEGYEDENKNSIEESKLPSWFVKPETMPLPTPRKATITLGYKVDASHNKKPIYMKFRAGNVRKRVEIVYDNGFLPNENLSEDKIINTNKVRAWKTNLPKHGVYLAKRGNVAPIAKAKDQEIVMVFSTNNDISHPKTNDRTEHGKGPSNTDAIYEVLYAYDSAAGRCKAMGEGWYLPSAYELSCIVVMNPYLGESYRYNKNLIWSSTSFGTSNKEMWVRTNMEMNSGDYLGIHPKQKSAAVRCIRNL